MAQLVPEEKLQIVQEGWVIAILYGAIIHISLDMGGGPGIHSREEHSRFLIIDLRFAVAHLVPVILLIKLVDRTVVFHILKGGVVLVSEKQRTVSVLLTVEVGEHGKGIVGPVLVHGRLCTGPDNGHGIGGVSDDKHRYTHQDGVHQCIFLLELGAVDAKAQQANEQEEVDGHTSIVAQPDSIGEEQLEPGCHAHEAGDDDVHGPQDRNGRQNSIDDSLAVHFVFSEVVDQNNGRDGKQVKQVNADGESDEIGNKDEPAVGVGLIGNVFPFQDGPEYHRGKEGRGGVNLCLHC